MEEGALAGTYQFSPDTVGRATEFYARVKHLPYKEGATRDFANTYLTSPGTKWLADLVARLPDTMHERKNRQAVWQWSGLALVLDHSEILANCQKSVPFSGI